MPNIFSEQCSQFIRPSKRVESRYDQYMNNGINWTLHCSFVSICYKFSLFFLRTFYLSCDIWVPCAHLSLFQQCLVLWSFIYLCLFDDGLNVQQPFCLIRLINTFMYFGCMIDGPQGHQYDWSGNHQWLFPPPEITIGLNTENMVCSQNWITLCGVPCGEY